MTRDGVGGVCEADEITTVGVAVPQTPYPPAQSQLSFTGSNCAAQSTVGHLERMFEEAGCVWREGGTLEAREVRCRGRVCCTQLQSRRVATFLLSS